VLQSEAYLAVVGTGAPPAGTSLVVRLARSSEIRNGAAVPFAAVVWAEGRPSVFVAASPDTFERRDVTIVRLRRGAWLATGGVAPGERVVARGASRLLSAEVLGAHPAEEED
jgi:multidrug efflux pump subunit AcrA (membrane-fusion protein)